MKTCTVVVSGFDFVAIVGYHCEIFATKEAAYSKLIDMVRETKPGEALAVDRDLMAEYLSYREEDAKERPDWSCIAHLKLMEAMEDRNIIRASDGELRVAANMARDYRHNCQ